MLTMSTTVTHVCIAPLPCLIYSTGPCSDGKMMASVDRPVAARCGARLTARQTGLSKRGRVHSDQACVNPHQATRHRRDKHVPQHSHAVQFRAISDPRRDPRGVAPVRSQAERVQYAFPGEQHRVHHSSRGGLGRSHPIARFPRDFKPNPGSRDRGGKSQGAIQGEVRRRLSASNIIPVGKRIQAKGVRLIGLTPPR